ncbi:unnamed protein product [Clonostachys rosea]|uniref:Uncharacterized protein n=1 Tax=Bionectria ochroleuca TaxID=29856 RepID=A0ABY6US58_BIOOC|nr:unnamed protein product [Clonostachys rosea]
MATTPYKVALGGLIGITYLGGFSRFTHGKYTPVFHQYQVDRAPDDESTRLIPIMDVTLATLLVFQRTRTVAALLCTFFQGVGLVMRITSRKPMIPDILLASVAGFVAWSSYKVNPHFW